MSNKRRDWRRPERAADHSGHEAAGGARRSWHDLKVPWRAVIVSAIIAAVVGAGLGWRLVPQPAVAEARVAVGDRSIAAVMVPGYTDATVSLAESFARYITLDSVKSSVPPSVTQVEATAIPTTPVIRIQVTAATTADAIKGANAAAKALVDQVSASDPTSAQITSLKAQYTEAMQKQYQLQARANTLSRASGADPTNDALVVEARNAQVQAAVAKSEADGLAAAYSNAIETSVGGHPVLTVVSQAAEVTDTKRPIMLGALAGLGLALVAWAAVLTLLQARRTR